MINSTIQGAVHVSDTPKGKRITLVAAPDHHYHVALGEQEVLELVELLAAPPATGPSDA